MRKLLFLLACLGLGFAQTSKVYTFLEAKQCKTLKEDSESDSLTQECTGVAGYRVFVDAGDVRENLRIQSPKGQDFSLDLWTVVGSGFSSLGPKVEWRLQKSKPYALIVRFNVSENPEDSSKITSYLVVVKITDKTICAVEKILPGPNANLLAQKSADSALTKACLK